MKMTRTSWLGALALLVGLTAATIQATAQQRAAVRVEGRVQAGASALVNSTVTLWAASAGEPRQLAQTRTGNDGGFQFGSQEAIGPDVILHVTAKGGEAAVNRGSGDNAAIAFLAVLGNTPPSTVVVTEMTTVASVWTNAQFLNGTSIKGHALRDRTHGGRLGHQQLARYRNLLRRASRINFDPLRRSRRRSVLRRGQACACAADRPGKAAVANRNI